MNAVADYTTPVSIDHAGSYPTKRPGDSWTETTPRGTFRCTLIGKPRNAGPMSQSTADVRWSGSVLCDMHVQQIA